MAEVGVDTQVGRRARRRLDTIDEVLEVALAVMADNGAGGLSLGEVARRMGMRPPSLYQYFDSKNAIYDALFARGWRRLNESMSRFEGWPAHISDAGAARGYAAQVTAAFVGWAVDNPAYAQLMFWRPVPGFEPSPQAYAPAVDSLDRLHAIVRGFVDHGWLHHDAATDQALRAYTCMVAGVISQHLSNEPHLPYAQGRFTCAVPLLNDMFFDRFRP